jgi:hypothetical protein
MLESMWKEAVVATFEIQAQNLPQGTEEYHDKSQDSRTPGRYLNLRPPKYVIHLTTKLGCQYVGCVLATDLHRHVYLF